MPKLIRMRALKNIGRYRIGDEFDEDSPIDAKILETLKVAERVQDTEAEVHAARRQRRTYRRRDMVPEGREDLTAEE